MNSNKKRENKMYFISQSEYIIFPLRVRLKTYIYSTTNNKKNQLVKCILSGK